MRHTGRLGLAILMLGAGPVFPCVCPERESLVIAYAEAKAVFVGRVVSLEAVPNRARLPGEDDMVATLRVERREGRQGSRNARQDLWYAGGDLHLRLRLSAGRAIPCLRQRRYFGDVVLRSDPAC